MCSNYENCIVTYYPTQIEIQECGPDIVYFRNPVINVRPIKKSCWKIEYKICFFIFIFLTGLIIVILLELFF